MKVLIAASEAVPYAKTGGLADVTGALFSEYRRQGIDGRLMLPLYRTVREHFVPVDTGLTPEVKVGDRRYKGRVWLLGEGAYGIGCDEFFDRPELYGTPQGDYPDNAARFSFFGRAVTAACESLGWRPDVIHCNDWQTALIPLLLKTSGQEVFFRETATVFTIHNLGYQGIFGAGELALTGLGPDWFNPEGIEFYGKLNFMKAGLIGADIITTVSTTYAREILTPEHGYGLDGVLRKRTADLFGVVNGIDTAYWDPSKDPLIQATYRPSDISGKAACNEALVRECGFSLSEGSAWEKTPVLALVGRLSDQKGLDILLDAADGLIALGARIVILGKGDEHIQERVRGFAEGHRGLAAATIGYDEALAHRIYSGSDFFLMPSRYEPCGLGQMIAMRYGTIPVARRTGGLADTIVDYDPLKGAGTGFLFDEYRPAALLECMQRAIRVYAEPGRWKALVPQAMQQDFSWARSAAAYVDLYRIAGERHGVRQ